MDGMGMSASRLSTKDTPTAEKLVPTCISHLIQGIKGLEAEYIEPKI